MRWLALTLLVAAVLAPAAAGADSAGPFPHPAATEPPFKAGDYWVFADRIASALDERWDAKAGSYWSPREDGGREHDTRFNASMLLGHAIAALKNHEGATRRDGRAQALVRRFTTRPGWGPIPGSAPQLSRPSRCWSTNLDQRKESYDDVIYAIANGGFSGAIMPQNIVVGADAEKVARFVEEYSGTDVEESPRPGQP